MTFTKTLCPRTDRHQGARRQRSEWTLTFIAHLPDLGMLLRSSPCPWWRDNRPWELSALTVYTSQSSHRLLGASRDTVQLSSWHYSDVWVALLDGLQNTKWPCYKERNAMLVVLSFMSTRGHQCSQHLSPMTKGWRNCVVWKWLYAGNVGNSHKCVFPIVRRTHEGDTKQTTSSCLYRVVAMCRHYDSVVFK